MKWEVKDKVMSPDQDLMCPFCKEKLVLRWSKVISHPDIMLEIARMADSGEEYKALFDVWQNMPTMFSYVDDQRWKCPHCHYTVLFGIPVDSVTARKLRDSRGGNASYIPLHKWLENEIIKKSLEDLGYF